MKTMRVSKKSIEQEGEAFIASRLPSLPRVLFVGGPDVDARLDLMHSISDAFEITVLGSDPRLDDKFSAQGFSYLSYPLNRRANVISDLQTLRELVRILRQLKVQIVHAFATKPC